MTSTVVAVVGVLLLSPFIHAQDPELIREDICRGVDQDQIVFIDRCRGDRVQYLSPITIGALCNRLVSLHENFNQAFLGVTVTVDDCIDALKSKRKYTQQELGEWSGSYCGDCTIISPPSTSAHNFRCDSPSPGPTHRSDCIHITPAGTSSGHTEAGSIVCNCFLYIYIYLHRSC